MELSGKKLGLMISTAPEHPNLATALGLAQAALDRGANVYLYLIDDGVRALADRRLRALPARGVKLFACAYGCQKRRIPLEDGDDIAKFRASLRQLGVPFHVEASAIPDASDWNADKHPVVPVSREDIADLMRHAGSFIVF